MARASTKKVPVATSSDRSPHVPTDGGAALNAHDIARRAYELYLARDRENGRDVEDWLQAEQELRHAEGSMV